MQDPLRAKSGARILRPLASAILQPFSSAISSAIYSIFVLAWMTRPLVLSPSRPYNAENTEITLKILSLVNVILCFIVY
jgi:hypothetical protein